MGVNDLEQVLPEGTETPAKSQPETPAPEGETVPGAPKELDLTIEEMDPEAPVPPEQKKEATPEGTPPEGGDGKDGDPVPYDRFAKVYGRMKALERENATLQTTPPVAAATPPQAPGPVAPVVSQEPKPLEKDFDTYEGFVEELTRWTTREENRTLQANQQNEQVQQRFEARLTAGAARMPDFETKAYIPAAVGDIVMRSEMAAELAYYWGEHREEALALLNMDPREQVYRIAQLEVVLKESSPARKKEASTTFPDLKTVDGVRDGDVTKPLNKMTPDEYITHMNQKEGIAFHD